MVIKKQFVRIHRTLSASTGKLDKIKKYIGEFIE